MQVKYLCLGALSLGNASGYEIRKLFETGPFSHFAHVSYGSIYPALTQLHVDGLVHCQEHTQNGKPDKKVYALTSAGLSQLKHALSQPPAADKFHSDALFMLFFADIMEPHHLHSVLDNYISHFDDAANTIDGLDTDGISQPRQHIRSMGVIFYRTMADYLKQHRNDILASPDQSANILKNISL